MDPKLQKEALGDSQPAGQAQSMNTLEEENKSTDPVQTENDIQAGMTNTSGVTLPDSSTAQGANPNPESERTKAPIRQ